MTTLQALREKIPVNKVHIIWSRRHEPERKHLIDLFPDACIWEPFWRQGLQSSFKDFTTQTKLGQGQVALTLTHLTILAEIESGNGYHLVLESDATININSINKLSGFIGCDVAWLDYQSLNEFRTGKMNTMNEGWHKPIAPLRTHALLISSEGAGKLLKNIRMLDRPYDWLLKDAVRGLNWIAHRGTFSWINYGHSNIMNNGVKL